MLLTKIARSWSLSQTRYYCIPGMILLVLGLLAGCGKKETTTKKTPSAQPVTAATATAKNVELFYDTLGMAVASESVDISSQVSGQIMTSPFTQGSMVQKGDLLFEIYKPPYEASLLEAKGSLAQAEAELEINQLNVDRNRSLVPQKLISEQDFQAMQATVKENLAAIETARGQVLSAEVNLGYTDIISPINGMVGIYNVNVGNIVTGMDGTTLTTVQKMDPMYIDFILPVPKFAELRKYFDEANQSLNIRAAYLSDPSKSREAPMTILGNEVSDQTGTVNLRATMKNPDGFFWPNQPVSVRVFLKELKDSVLVPSAAVSTGQSGQFVFVIGDGNTVTQTSVTVGQKQDDGNVVIYKGVKKGDKVVTDGQLMIRTGSKVKITKLDGKATSAATTSSTTSTSSDSGKTDSKQGS
ncbi:efflux RND transporter periplasmic adaptor subunit [Rubellicoccus peritrichatus]|uniref:Efflux RND transporter periplasmic adaptor subunit n=1 Tax=Rubellicoccus peritrichatus TaxID=3080537 RepID=A0AAQ3L5V7_9BACT|nr:efflux RND transporter periplasmic adaptor subunit [Puniceicoccus sp. CR14]WOO39800.1 efflux RND transporter periplasmic adaptor subunit [Puniceicoccus sp. CR14]